VLSSTEVRVVVNPDPARVTAGTDLVDAARLLHDNKLFGLLVVDDGDDLVGIFTTTNALEALIVTARRG
jgi:acetoin utilization protein AcuB